MTDEVFNIVSAIGIGLTFLASIVLMLSWAVIISLCHAVMRLPGYLSRPFQVLCKFKKLI